MSIDDTDLDTALRQWGDEQRTRAADPAVPPIVDLLSGRRRRHNLAAIAASVALVASLAGGLELGLPGSRHNRAPQTGEKTSVCAQQIQIVSSQIDAMTAKGTVTLQYRGQNPCRILSIPQLALIDRQSRSSVGASMILARFDTSLSVRPGEVLRFALRGLSACLVAPAGEYELAVFLRRVASAGSSRGASAVIGPVDVGNLDRPAFACRASQPVRASRLQILPAPTASPVLRRLTHVAYSAASTIDDSHATGQAVRTTEGAYANLRTPNIAIPNGDDQIWVVQLLGPFACRLCQGRTSPHGNALVLIVSAPGLQLMSELPSDGAIDLSKLGHVVQLIP